MYSAAGSLEIVYPPVGPELVRDKVEVLAGAGQIVAEIFDLRVERDEDESAVGVDSGR